MVSLSSRPQRGRRDGQEKLDPSFPASARVCVLFGGHAKTPGAARKHPSPSMVSVRGAPARPATDLASVSEKLRVAHRGRCDQEKNK